MYFELFKIVIIIQVIVEMLEVQNKVSHTFQLIFDYIDIEFELIKS